MCCPDLFSLNRIMTFKQRYAIVAFIKLRYVTNITVYSAFFI